MYTNSRSAANAYANVGLETGVAAASPHQLIVMLYEGAELAVRMAIRHMNEGDLARKSAAITKASSIILDGLRAALDPQQGGDIALQLLGGGNEIDIDLRRRAGLHVGLEEPPGDLLTDFVLVAETEIVRCGKSSRIHRSLFALIFLKRARIVDDDGRHQEQDRE